MLSFINIFLYCYKTCNFVMLNVRKMSNCIIVLCIWLSFVALVYLYAWLDALYYKYNFPRICRRILDAFTEED